jgi:dipeptidyl aminopeptidase/acylaminoacyl peptidase
LHPDALQELYLHDESGERRLTSLNEDGLADRDLSLPEPFTVLHENTTLDAWIVKPIGFDPNARYPSILTVHGGPRAAFGDVFFHEMQCLAAHGYALIYANPRGSSGRGNEFADLRKKYGTIDYEDLMHVLDVALEQYPFLDETRLGIMGGSYGGFMTNWAVGQTDRFKAAVSQRSIANWTSKFNTTDIGYYFNQDALGTTPWEAGGADTMWQHSPLRYADRVSTPTLFIHSEQDYRCWLAEGLQMFTALRYHGVESRLVMFRGENHELSRSGKPKHRVRRLREICDWFDRYLKA